MLCHTTSSHQNRSFFTWLFCSVLSLTILQPDLLRSYRGRTSLPFAFADSVVQPGHFSELHHRANTPVDICLRWAQQSAVVNSTLYLYGGQAKSQPTQTQDTWNNDFLSLDLTKSWPISTPLLTGLPQPSGPPNVSLGYLWNSYQQLYLYGGEVEWKSSGAPVMPSVFALWEYAIASKSWIEHSNPKTSSGVNANSDGVAVQRAAEGAGVAVPSLGRGFYFGGHLDHYTTPGWSVQVARVYLQSLLEYTFPGHSNTQVNSLSTSQQAGPDGVYRNITQGGLQAQAGFTARADGLLIYVPGFGDEGILLALAGGTNTTFTQMNSINIYDIATSSWYNQATSGPTPNIRVNPCAVVAAAQDGSSYNIYMFGGQNLTPYGDQTQYQDMWILTIPSFTWIQIDQSGQSVPYPRSGATCNIWDGQMVMVGGYVGADLSCETPGIYVFDLSTLKWMNSFTALDTGSNNPLHQQPAQISNATYTGGLEGSYGYEVPDPVISIVGGGKTGGATITTPVATATEGPLATGKPLTYTVTGPIPTATDSSGSDSSQGGSSANSSNDHARVAAIAVGVVAGLLLILACYLAFCAYVYRKQLQLYKNHVEMAQRQAQGDETGVLSGLFGGSGSIRGHRRSGSVLLHKGSSDTYHDSNAPGTSSHTSEAHNGYQNLGRNSQDSGVEDILTGHEPTFVGVMLHPRRSLRVINRD